VERGVRCVVCGFLTVLLKEKIKIISEEGLEKGEAKKTEQFVINSYRAGIPIETIAIITNLTVEQVIEILKQHSISD